MPVVQFGLSTDDRRKLFKQVSFSVSADCYIKDNRSIVNPVFILDYNPAIISLNYAYVSEFGRYYFINNISVAPGGKMEVDCSVDVLQTYNNQIASLSVEVSRQEFLVEPYLPDSNFVCTNNYDVISLLPNSNYNDIYANQVGSNNCYIVGIAGGRNEHNNEIAGFELIESIPSDWEVNYPMYFGNFGSTTEPNMMPFGEAIFEEIIKKEDANDFDRMSSLYGVYKKEGR